MPLVDVHTHLQADVFSETVDDVIKEAVSCGITGFITNATAPSDWEKCLTLSEKYPCVSAALGIHPWYIPAQYENELQRIYGHKDSITAIGECGLDSRFSDSPIDQQITLFHEHLTLANLTGLPLIVHCIGAFDELKKILKESPNKTPLIIHAFNGSQEQARELTRYNCFFSVGGVVTYRDSKKRAAMLQYIFSESKMLLESDAPDIPPIEKKGEINRPAFINFTISALSEITETEPSFLVDKINTTTRKIFGTEMV